ncbi:unnamed protein product [Taenia asiatica]|uniref:Uncharacterized protein n=1 Tax=Taenia asiatica TaxID=60517 RepID=A0A0R3WGU2_TAEAS|nr:unnamed protein product [Taenia asiatica]
MHADWCYTSYYDDISSKLTSPLSIWRLSHSNLIDYVATSLFVLGPPPSTIHHPSLLMSHRHWSARMPSSDQHVDNMWIGKLGMVMVWDSGAPCAFQHDSPTVALSE